MELSLAVFRTAGDTGTQKTGLPASALHEIEWNPFSPGSVVNGWKRLSALIGQPRCGSDSRYLGAQSAMAAWLAQARRKPYIVSAHGMLDAWALRNKRLKKAVYSMLIERPNLRRAACLRALTRMEAEDYRSFGLRVPIAVIPNGVSIPEPARPSRFWISGRRFEVNG